LSPAIPISRLLLFIAENSGVILTVAGSVSLAYILTRPKNQQDINSSLANLNQAIGQVGNQVASMSTPVATEVLKQLDQTRQQLKSFQEKLALIDKVLPIAKEYLGKVTRLLQKLDQVSSNLSNKVRANPLNIDPAVPSTYSDTFTPGFPASPNVDSGVRDRGTREVQRQIPPVSWPKPNPAPSKPPITRDQGQPVPAPIPIPDGVQWSPIGKEPKFPIPQPWDVPLKLPKVPGDRHISQSGGPRLVPNDTPFGPHPIDNPNPFGDVFAQTKPVPRARPISRAKPKVDTNQPGCKDPNSWSEKFKQFLEYAIDQLGQELIQTMADRAGEVFEKAFAARDEAIRKNPDFDKGKPDLKKTLEDSIGKEYDKLSSQTKKDLNEYYSIKDQPDGRPIASRKYGRGNDPTLPPIQIKNGIVIPELLANNNRLSSGIDLGKEFAKGHGFNPTKSGVLKTAINGQALSPAYKALIGPVQIHHKVPDALWQSHPLTQAMQTKINAGSKNILGLNDGSNLIASYKSPEAKLEYQKMLAEIGKTNPQLQRSIEGNLRHMESTKAMLSDLYHNGSHDRWNQRAERALDKQVGKLKERFPDLSKVPEKDLNKAYTEATKELGDKLHKANKNIKQKQPLSEEERDWAKDYCNPKDKQKKKPYTRISANPDKGTAWDKLIVATNHLNEPSQKNSNDRLASASLNSQSLQAENTEQKVRHNPVRSPIWAETMNLARQLNESSKNQSLQPENTSYETQQGSTKDFTWAETMKLANELKASHEAQAAQREEKQIASQTQENIKQSKRGFEYGA
jgi:hypothetical protein